MRQALAWLSVDLEATQLEQAMSHYVESMTRVEESIRADSDRARGVMHSTPRDPDWVADRRWLVQSIDRHERSIVLCETQLFDGLRPLVPAERLADFELLALQRRHERFGGSALGGWTNGAFPTVMASFIDVGGFFEVATAAHRARGVELLRELVMLLESYRRASIQAAPEMEVVLSAFLHRSGQIAPGDAAGAAELSSLASEYDTLTRRPRELAARIAGMNREILVWFEDAVPKEMATALKLEWLSIAFPGVYPDRESAERHVERAGQLSDLDDESRTLLVAMKAEYRERLGKVNQALERLSTQRTEATSPLSVDALTIAELDRRFEAALAERSLLHAAFATRLVEALTPEQVQVISSP